MAKKTAVPLSDTLRELRLAAGLSQQDLSDRSSVSKFAICKIERGKTLSPTRATIVALALGLGIAPAELRANNARHVNPLRGPQQRPRG